MGSGNLKACKSIDVWISIVFLLLLLFQLLVIEVFEKFSAVGGKAKEIEETKQSEEKLKNVIQETSSTVQSDSQTLNRLARGADYVDKFDWMDTGKSHLVNPQDVKDFAKDPSLNLITSYGEDRIIEENILRNLFKTSKNPVYIANEKERKKYISKNASKSFESPIMTVMRKFGFGQKS